MQVPDYLEHDLVTWLKNPRFYLTAIGSLFVAFTLLGWYWSSEPALEPLSITKPSMAKQRVVGQATTETLIYVAETLLDKPGGYLSNDRFPPGAWIDNMPNWEFGVLVQVRDLAKSLRNDMSRSQSQSIEDPDLAKGEPQFSFNNDAWLFPASESEYRKGISHLKTYRARLAEQDDQLAQFYARADNLASWLLVVDKRLGSLSQRLSASVGQRRINTDLAGEPDASQATPVANEFEVKTSWWSIDDVFYESRGTAWALVHFLRAIEADFRDILVKKNALISLRQIIRELEVTQTSLWSPMILNGGGFGMLANHSLVMASYISRANSGVINLREILSDG